MRADPDGSPPDDLPRAVGGPATRARHAAGYRTLTDLDGVAVGSLLRLHGAGPEAVTVLRRAMAGQGLALG
jgi:hypothetical protein